jgi:uncharacterized protein (TIGR00369 family)
MIEPASMDRVSLQSLIDTVFAPWVRELGLRVTHAQTDEVHLSLPITTHHVHGGGVVCGQTLMSAADTAMVLAVSSQLGGFKPMTTVQLQTSFMRPISGTDTEARIIARVLRMGKSLVFGEIEVQDAYGRLAAHCTTTYALL